MPAPQLPAAGSLLPDAGTDFEVTGRLEQMLAVERQLPGASAGTDLVLDANNGGRVVPTVARHRVDTFANAPSGSLAKLGVDNMDLGRTVKLSIVSSLRPVTFKHAGGTSEQLLLAAGADMAVFSDTATLTVERKADGWHEVDRWWGTQTGSWRDLVGVDPSAGYPLASQSEAEAGGLNNRSMSPLRTRQALVAPWVASLSLRTAGTARAVDAVLYWDGTNFQRVAVSDLLLGAPYRRYDSGSVAVLDIGFQELTHTLGVAPTIVTPWLVCASTEFGYPVGAQVQSPDLRAYTLGTTIVAWEAAMSGGGSPTPAIYVAGGSQRITNAKWRVRLVAYV